MSSNVYKNLHFMAFSLTWIKEHFTPWNDYKEGISTSFCTVWFGANQLIIEWPEFESLLIFQNVPVIYKNLNRFFLTFCNFNASTFFKLSTFRDLVKLFSNWRMHEWKQTKGRMNRQTMYIFGFTSNLVLLTISSLRMKIWLFMELINWVNEACILLSHLYEYTLFSNFSVVFNQKFKIEWETSLEE